MIRCMICGVVFDEPAKNVRQDRVDGFSHSRCEYVCPCCGNSEAYFEDVEECNYCDGYRREDTDMCGECHEQLMEEVAEFLSQYDAAQVAALDDQLDGVAVGDFIRRYTKKE